MATKSNREWLKKLEAIDREVAEEQRLGLDLAEEQEEEDLREYRSRRQAGRLTARALGIGEDN